MSYKLNCNSVISIKKESFMPREKQQEYKDHSNYHNEEIQPNPELNDNVDDLTDDLDALLDEIEEILEEDSEEFVENFIQRGGQ